MFIESLSEAEQEVFVAVAQAIIAADGELHAKEVAAFSRSTRMTPLDALPVPGTITVPEGLFESDAARASFLLDLCGIAAADGTVTDDERAILDEVAMRLGAADGVVDELLSYARELTEMLDRGTQLVAEGVR